MICPGLSRQRTVSFPHEALESDRIITDRGPSVLTFPDSSCQSPETRAPVTSCAASGAETAATSPATARAIRRTAILPGGPVRLKDRCGALRRQIAGDLLRGERGRNGGDESGDGEGDQTHGNPPRWTGSPERSLRRPPPTNPR